MNFHTYRKKAFCYRNLQKKNSIKDSLEIKKKLIVFDFIYFSDITNVD